MINPPFQQVGDFGYGVILENNTSKGYINATPRAAPNDNIVDEAICSDTLTSLPNQFRLQITFGQSHPGPSQTQRLTTVDTWTQNAAKSGITIASDLTAYREIRFAPNGDVQAIWLEQPKVGSTRNVLLFGADWSSQTNLYVTLRTDLDTAAKREAAAETFLDDQPSTVTRVDAVWTYP